jgi:hypothetical protein
MSALRVRFQVLLMKVLSMKVRHNLISPEPGFQPMADILQTDEQEFSALSVNLMTEMHEARGSVTIHRHLWIGHASRLFAGNRPGPDNSHLISLYLREFWFSPMDL